MSYVLRDESGVTEAIDASSIVEAREAAREWARDGDWNTEEGYVYVDVAILEDGEVIETVTEPIGPEEPDCDCDGTHDWQSPHDIVGGLRENPGVHGHGGGVTITACCMRCGCKRVEDTWAQRRYTGEQGFTEITYEVDAFADEIADNT